MTATTPNPIPEGPRLSPSLIARDALRALDFYVKAFGAKEIMRLTEPSGRLGHADLEIAGARVMLADEYPEYGFLAPPSVGGTSITLHVYVEDVDAFAERAVAAGAILDAPISNEFYGDRIARLRDPFGHRWTFASRIELVSQAEIERRFAAMF